MSSRSPAPAPGLLRLAWLAVLPLAPLLLLQGLWVRRRMPRLAEAAPPFTGRYAGSGDNRAPPFRVVVLGESTAAGVGAAAHDEALAGQLAVCLGESVDRPLDWLVLGENGIDLAGVRARLVARLAPFRPDLVVVALGVNDTTGLTRLVAWERGLRQLCADLRAAGVTLAVFSPVPPMDRFTGLPQPLRAVLGLRARLLDAVLARTVAAQAGCLHVPLRFPADAGCLARDGFHPSPSGYRAWARQIADHPRVRAFAAGAF